MKNQLLIIFFLIMATGCKQENNLDTYDNILNLIKTHTNPIELVANDGQSRIIVVPEFQGRVANSTNSGISGIGLGWLNNESLESGKELNGSEIHGEERVWIGPQGSQHSFYYGRTKPLHDDNWQVPTSFDGEPFNVVFKSDHQIQMSKKIKLTNHIGTKFNMELEREIRILENNETEKRLNLKIPKELSVVAYISEHILTNKDSLKWQKETGLAGIWSLSTFKGSDKTTTFIPLKTGSSSNQIFQYLNTFEEDRYTIQNNVAWYKTDGKYRSKIGVPPELSLGYFGSYQPETNTLRIIHFLQNENDSLYFNTHLTVQENPYKGEAIAVYNNGPMDLQVGNESSFFEMESMAAMKELKPNESIKHFHLVYQITGDFEKLNKISKAFLGVDLRENPFSQ